MQALDISHDKINVNGGAIAMGHPLGATGAMILGTVLDELERRDKSTALVTLCIGIGMGTATIIERGLRVMPKIDIDKIPVDAATGLSAAISGRVMKGARASGSGRRRRPHAIRRQHLRAQAGRALLAAPLARAMKMNSSTCWKARWCCARTTARPC